MQYESRYVIFFVLLVSPTAACAYCGDCIYGDVSLTRILQSFLIGKFIYDQLKVMY